MCGEVSQGGARFWTGTSSSTSSAVHMPILYSNYGQGDDDSSEIRLVAFSVGELAVVLAGIWQRFDFKIRANDLDSSVSEALYSNLGWRTAPSWQHKSVPQGCLFGRMLSVPISDVAI